MKRPVSFVDRLAPDTINQLERAARMRHDDAVQLLTAERGLGALYLFGYSVEMCLTAAYFRAFGLSPNAVIDRETRQQRMAQARRLRSADGTPLMNSDPHPLVGWARFLEWQHLASRTTEQRRRRLLEAIARAEVVYNHWRPELRYKTTDVKPNQLREVRIATTWFMEQCGRL